ncbi:hypothetical protein LTR37_013251 [Vermiconidia calcicola]|uniref:Uncharacterized protein n=1 Tax=Vermiconidia calcicola TaxID=1690605 RepID=A0ACC3MYI6_9PEZI|nr:hypothetical protein LTR37_013251 [Vermiconidia calcicola]
MSLRPQRDVAHVLRQGNMASGHRAATAHLRHMATDAIATLRRVYIQAAVTCTYKNSLDFYEVDLTCLAKLTVWIDRDAKHERCKCTVYYRHQKLPWNSHLCKTGGRTQAKVSRILHDMDSNTGAELFQKQSSEKLLQVLRPNRFADWRRARSLAMNL